MSGFLDSICLICRMAGAWSTAQDSTDHGLDCFPERSKRMVAMRMPDDCLFDTYRVTSATAAQPLEQYGQLRDRQFLRAGGRRQS
jgi:hypothetical protein